MNLNYMEALREVHEDVLDSLREKYGADKVQKVDNLGQSTTERMLKGECVEGVENWMYDVVSDFERLLFEHPKVSIPRH